jgi:hypothetical protein
MHNRFGRGYTDVAQRTDICVQPCRQREIESATRIFMAISSRGMAGQAANCRVVVSNVLIDWYATVVTWIVPGCGGPFLAPVAA